MVEAEWLFAGFLDLQVEWLCSLPLPPDADVAVEVAERSIQLLAAGQVVGSRELRHTLQRDARLLWAVAQLALRQMVQLTVAEFAGNASSPSVTLRIALSPSFFDMELGDELAPHSALMLEHLLSASEEERDGEDGIETHENGATWQASHSRVQPMDAVPGDDGQDVRNRVFCMVLPSDWQLEESDPPGLLCSLFRYQRRELAWALWRESLGQGKQAHPAPCDPESLKSQLPQADILWQQARLPSGLTVHVNAGVARLHPVQPPLREVVGGILCDEMGLGKTVEAIALCMASRPPARAAAAGSGGSQVGMNGSLDAVSPAAAAVSPAGPAAKNGTAGTGQSWRPGGTLVICPPALLQQWRAEIGNHAAGSLSVFCYEGLRGLGADASEAEDKGKKKGRKERKKPAQREMELYNRLLAGEPLDASFDSAAQAAAAVEELVHADVVLTTFDVLRAEVHYTPQAGRSLRHAKRYAVPVCPLLQVSWWRAIVDEAQMVGSFSAAGVMVHRLEARSIWALTGTPLRGSTLRHELDSLAGLLLVVKHPLGDPAAWRRLVAQPLEHGSAARQREAWRLLEQVLRPLMWRNNKQTAAEEHQLPPRKLKVTRLTFQAGESEFYRQAVERTKAARQALLDFRHGAQEEQSAEAAGAAAAAADGSEAGPSSPTAAPKTGRSALAARKRKQRDSERLEAAALDSLTQLRLACIHPQLTTFWSELSNELQLSMGGTLSMDEVLSRLADKASFELQDAERSLCANLNSLAMALLGKGSKAAAAAAAAADGSHHVAPDSPDGKGKAKEAAVEEEEEEAWEGDSPARPSKKARRSGGGKGGPVAGSSEAVQEALHLLEQSFKVAEKGIDALPDSVTMADLKSMPDIEAASGATVSAWKKLQLNTAAQLGALYRQLGRLEDAARMDADVRDKGNYLKEHANMAVVNSEQRVQQLRQQIAGTQEVFGEALRAAHAAGFPMRWGSAHSASAWVERLQRVYEQAEADEREELQQQEGIVRATLGTVVHKRLSEIEKEVQHELNGVEGYVSSCHIREAVRRLERTMGRMAGMSEGQLKEACLDMGRMNELLPSFKRDSTYAQFWFLLPRPKKKEAKKKEELGQEQQQQQQQQQGQQQGQEQQEQQQRPGQEQGSSQPQMAGPVQGPQAQQVQDGSMQAQQAEWMQVHELAPSGAAAAPTAATEDGAEPFTAAQPIDRAALAAVQLAAAEGSAFIASTTWLGPLDSYVFKLGDAGQLGYHRDTPPNVAPLHTPELVARLAATVQRQLHSELRKLQQAAGDEVAVLSACPLSAVESKQSSLRLQLDLVRLHSQLHVASANMTLQEGLREDVEEEVRQAAEERPVRHTSAASLRRAIDSLTKQALELRGKRMFMRNKALEARGLGQLQQQQSVKQQNGGQQSGQQHAAQQQQQNGLLQQHGHHSGAQQNGHQPLGQQGPQNEQQQQLRQQNREQQQSLQELWLPDGQQNGQKQQGKQPGLADTSSAPAPKEEAVAAAAAAPTAVPGPSQQRQVECPVCLSIIRDDINVFTGCGHAFCTDCTAKLVLQGGTCAVCRQKVTAKQVFRVAANRSSTGQQQAAGLDPDAARMAGVTVLGEWSIKILALLRRILHLAVTAPQEKCLVFSRFPEALKLVALALQTNHVRYCQLLGGKMAVRKALQQFLEESEIRVFLLSHKAGAAGLTLTRANHVFLLEPSLDIAIEQQAIARVHRIGQVRPVFIERFLIDGTIEEAVVRAAERKQALLTEEDETQVASVDHQAAGEGREEVAALLQSI